MVYNQRKGNDKGKGGKSYRDLTCVQAYSTLEKEEGLAMA